MTEHQAKAFLTNFGTKILHQVGDSETAEYASALLGKYKETSTSVSPGQRRGITDEMSGESGMSVNISESYQPVLQPAVFYDLPCGGPPSFIVGGIVIRNGRWLYVEFSQR